MDQEPIAHFPLMEKLGLFQLSVDDRIELAMELWDSISPEEQPPPPDWQKKEIERRLHAHRANPSEGCSWEEVKARLVERLSR